MQEKSEQSHQDKSPDATLPNVSKRGSHRLWKIFLFLLGLSVLALLFYIGAKAVVFDREIKQLQGDVRILMSSQVKTSLLTEQHLSEFAQSLGQQQSRLSETKSQIKNLVNRTPTAEIRALKLGEIQYIIRLAQIELSLKHNIPSALVLLKQAENQTTQLSSDNPQSAKLSDFHAMLLKDIGLLQSAGVVDKENLSERIEHLKDNVSGLSMLVSPKPNTSLLESTPHQEHKHWYQRAWDNVKASFRALIIVRHQEDKIPALMSPEEKIYLQENLQLLLVRAQWALINYQPDVYEKNLKQAASWVEKYYVQNSLSTLSFLKELNILIHQNISPAVPDLMPLLTALPKEI